MIPVFIEIAKVIADVAPTLASAFLSPAAGIALKLVTNAIPSLDNNATPEQLLDHITHNPDHTWTDVIKNVEGNYGGIIKPLLAGKWPRSIEVKVTWGDD